MNEVVFETMDKMFNQELSDVELPLIKKRRMGRGNRGYGSSLDDYTYINYFYYSDHDHEDPIFIEWDDNHLGSDEKWTVNDRLEIIYNFFGESKFEDFIKWKFGLDITNKGNKKYNWTF